MANTAVFGIYGEKEEAIRAVDALHRAGYRATDISALLAANRGSKDLAHRKDTKAPEGAAAGAAIGIIVGAILGWLAGIGLITADWLDPFIGAGLGMMTMAGIGAGAIIGGIIGALAGLALPEYVVRRYKGRIRDSGILLSVHCDNSEWVSRAESILEATGGRDIAAAAEAPADFLRTDKPMPRRVAGSKSFQTGKV